MMSIKINLSRSSRQIFSICFFAITLFLFAVLAKAQVTEKTNQLPANQQVNSAELLKLNQSAERQIKGGEIHSFQFDVKAGFYARAEVEQKNIDVIVSLFAPDGKFVVEMDGKDGRLWREAVSAIAEKSGLYRVEIKAYGAADKSGSFTLKLIENRQSVPSDSKRLKTETHLSAGRKFYEQSKYQEAVKEYETAIQLWRELNDVKWEAVSLVNLGLTYSNLTKNELAISAHTQATELFQKTKDRIGESNSLHGLGNVFSNISQYEKARESYEKALTIRREIKDRRGEGETLNNLGRVYGTLAQYEKARDYFEQSLLIRREIKNRRGEGLTLMNLGIIYFYLAQYEKARDYYEQSLLIRREIKDRRGEGATLNSLGIIYGNLAQYEKARDYFEQALVINREIKDRRGEGETLNNLGNVYRNLAQYEKARDYYEQALVINREIKDRRGEGLTLNNLGLVYYNLAQYEKARDYFEQALLISREIKDRYGEGLTLNNLGLVYNALAQYEKAKDYHEQSLLISREIKDRQGEGSTLNNLGRVYGTLAQYEKARDYFEQSLLISREIKDKEGEGAGYRNLLDLYQRLKNPNLAIINGKQAVNVYQEIRGNIKGLDKESQQSFLKDKEPVYRSLADILISEGRFPEAQAVLDLLKEEEFKQIARRSGEPLVTLPYSRTEEEAIKIVDRLASLGRELSDLKAKSKDSLTAEDTKRMSEIESTEIPSANKALRQAIEALSIAAPDVKNALDLRMKDNIQNILPALGKGVVALYTVIGKTTADENAGNNIGNKTGNNKINVGWILLVTPEFRKAYPIDTTDLEQTVFKFRDALRSAEYDPQPIAQELYKKLFLQTSAKQKTTLAVDLETYLGKQKDKTLMWSLDGVLRYVPMSALHDGKDYLVEKYRNVVFNTASLGSLKDSPKQNWEVAGLGVSTGVTVKAYDGRALRFSSLFGAEKELNAIVKEKNGVDANGIFPGTLKINNDFTKEALFEGARTGMPVIHISSHFWFNPAQEETSFLLLGNGGRLEMTEFQDYPNLFSTVDFLSLSACDTATGGTANTKSSSAVAGKAENEQKARESNGKEIEGFAYLAQTLGAKSVMASLWQVSDRGTKELMLKFYQIKKEQPGLPKGEALRQAQLSLLHGMNKAQVDKGGEAGLTQKRVEALKPFKHDEKAPFGHPFYWSPFILIGNWR